MLFLFPIAEGASLQWESVEPAPYALDIAVCGDGKVFMLTPTGTGKSVSFSMPGTSGFTPSRPVNSDVREISCARYPDSPNHNALMAWTQVGRNQFTYGGGGGIGTVSESYTSPMVYVHQYWSGPDFVSWPSGEGRYVGPSGLSTIKALSPTAVVTVTPDRYLHQRPLTSISSMYGVSATGDVYGAMEVAATQSPSGPVALAVNDDRSIWFKHSQTDWNTFEYLFDGYDTYSLMMSAGLSDLEMAPRGDGSYSVVALSSVFGQKYIFRGQLNP